MKEFENIISIILSLIKANIFAAILVFLLYLIEINTNFKLFVKQFKWKKSTKNARIHRNGDQVYYFIFCCIVYVYEIYKGTISLTIISFIIWLILLIILSTIFGKLYDKYQGIDPGKADDDYT